MNTIGGAGRYPPKIGFQQLWENKAGQNGSEGEPTQPFDLARLPIAPLGSEQTTGATCRPAPS